MWCLLAFGDEAVQVGEGAVLRIDGLVVGDVVAEVDLRRGIHGSDPDGVDAELLEVVEARGDAVEVADAVAVGVLKAARIDLVDDGVLPPGIGRSGLRGRGREGRREGAAEKGESYSRNGGEARRQTPGARCGCGQRVHRNASNKIGETIGIRRRVEFTLSRLRS